MYRKVLIGGVTAAAILGAGGTALAVTGSDTTGGTPSVSAAAAGHAGPGSGKGKARLLKRMAHAQIVTRGHGGFVTHDLIKGTVTSVSATSISVQAADKVTFTFVVDKDTRVRLRAAGKGAHSSIGEIATGDQVLVAGTGTSTYTAKRIVAAKK